MRDRAAGAGGRVVSASSGDQQGRVGARRSGSCLDAVLAVRVREAGRPGEVESLLQRALEIREAMLEANHVDVAVTRYELGRCVREAGAGKRVVSASAADR